MIGRRRPQNRIEEIGDLVKIVAALVDEVEQLRHEVVLLKQEAAERQRAEQEVRRATEETEALFGALPDLKLRLGYDVEVLSHRTGAVVKAPAAELAGQRIQDVMPRQVSEHYASGIRQVMDTGSRMRFEYVLDEED